MIITDDLVMLNFPKTGSSFAREVLKRVYHERESRFHKLLNKIGLARPCVQELLVPQIDDATRKGARAQHGTLRQIPTPHRHKPIVSITRNPFARYVSLYRFRWWEKVPLAEKHALRARFPHYPKLSFAEYYELEHHYGRKNRLHGIVPKIDLGLQSLQFIQFFFPNPDSVLRKIDHDYIDQGRYWEDMGDVHFLHQENLNQELKEFLLGMGMDRKTIECIDATGKVNVTEREPGERAGHDYYAGTLVQENILQRDRLLFAIFPEYLPIFEDRRGEARAKRRVGPNGHGRKGLTLTLDSYGEHSLALSGVNDRLAIDDRGGVVALGGFEGDPPKQLSIA